ncbi:MAG: nucleotidyltransferase family protein [Oscillospiraceae bacterium]|nr:nucleotidyltransferase family protein [Oscillospiraceae bacterium]
MNAVGIVAEYNPFHKGHEYHINRTKELLGTDLPVVAVMSGDFVQRGECAIFDKFARAKAAVLSGADLVVELPAPYVLSSAENYALSSVSLLKALRVSHMSFGSECGDIKTLESLAELVCSNSFINELKSYISENPTLSFASARQILAEKYLGKNGKLLGSPNNILAVEYLKAIKNLETDITPVTVKRVGAGHDTESDDLFRSASDIRERIFKEEDYCRFIPENSFRVFREETERGRGPVSLSTLETAALSRLRSLDRDDYSRIKDAEDGLGNRIYENIRKYSSLEDTVSASVTKKHPASRVRRVLMNAVLGITADQTEGLPPYLRVLAANVKGTEYLSSIRESALLPVIAKSADIRAESGYCRRVFDITSLAHDFYVLGFKGKENLLCGEDYRYTPFIKR